MTLSNRAEAVAAFRGRLLELIERSHESRAAFAARAGMDRSTLSQLLSSDNERLPRAETVLAIAEAGQVSCDWLLGVSQDEHQGTEVVRSDMEIESGAGTPMDERLARWHREASGYKIRYIPTTLPDLLKTEDVIHYECPDLHEQPPEASVEQSAHRLDYSRHPDTEMEVGCSSQMLLAFARGEGVWHGLGVEQRRAQLDRMIQLTEELYPTFRWHLYDGLRHYSVPVTLFGPKRAIVYVGDHYLVFNTTAHIRVLTQHFDKLVRHATTQPTGIVDYLRGLIECVR
jgi:transcriptional regulator with XRE-family HTH domain